MEFIELFEQMADMGYGMPFGAVRVAGSTDPIVAPTGTHPADFLTLVKGAGVEVAAIAVMSAGRAGSEDLPPRPCTVYVEGTRDTAVTLLEFADGAGSRTIHDRPQGVVGDLMAELLGWSTS